MAVTDSFSFSSLHADRWSGAVPDDDREARRKFGRLTPALPFVVFELRLWFSDFEVC
jgi:hypothetical protein